MPTRSLMVPLSGFGCTPTQAHVTVAQLSAGQRFARAGTVAAAGLGAALLALPIPLVHFIFVPAALIGGLVAGALRLRQREIFERAEAPCPYCGSAQRLGLAGRKFGLPRKVHCRACGRSLELGRDATPA
jgi:hypothetical protein